MSPSSSFGERYAFVRRLGPGSAADVWLAEDRQLGRRVALKALREAGDDAAPQEAVLLARFQHPSIVAIYDLVTIETRPYLVMEYIEGESLAQRLQYGPLSEAQARSIGVQAANALAYMHARHFVHGDIKPANILLDADGRLHLTDFGAARSIHTLTPAEVDEVRGTLPYLAPEVIAGEPQSPASDLFALGVTLWQAAAGRLPFDGAVASLARRLESPPPSLLQVADGVSPAFDRALHRAMSPNPRDRWSSVSAFAAELSREAPLAIYVVEPEEASPGLVAVSLSGRYRRAAVSIGAIAAGLAMLGAGGIFWANGRASGSAPTPSPPAATSSIPLAALEKPTPTSVPPSPTPTRTARPVPTPKVEPTPHTNRFPFISPEHKKHRKWKDRD